jgi:hypothetical protein
MAQKVPFSRLRLSAPALPSRNPATGGSRRSSRSSSCSFRPAEQTSLSFSQLSLVLCLSRACLDKYSGFSMKRHPKRAFPHRQQRIGRGDCLERLMRRKQGGKTPLWFFSRYQFRTRSVWNYDDLPRQAQDKSCRKLPRVKTAAVFSFLTVRVPLGKRS